MVTWMGAKKKGLVPKKSLQNRAELKKKISAGIIDLSRITENGI
jgi:hypothetical protein